MQGQSGLYFFIGSALGNGLRQLVPYIIHYLKTGEGFDTRYAVGLLLSGLTVSTGGGVFTEFVAPDAYPPMAFAAGLAAGYIGTDFAREISKKPGELPPHGGR